MKVEAEVAMTPLLLAQAFEGMADEEQAQFFIEVHKLANEWDSNPDAQHSQWYLVGKHLRDCSCSDEGTRDMIRSIARGARVDDY